MTTYSVHKLPNSSFLRDLSSTFYVVVANYPGSRQAVDIVSEKDLQATGRSAEHLVQAFQNVADSMPVTAGQHGWKIDYTRQMSDGTKAVTPMYFPKSKGEDKFQEYFDDWLTWRSRIDLRLGHKRTAQESSLLKTVLLPDPVPAPAAVFEPN